MPRPGNASNNCFQLRRIRSLRPGEEYQRLPRHFGESYEEANAKADRCDWGDRRVPNLFGHDARCWIWIARVA